MKRNIKLSLPHLSGSEQKYIDEAMRDCWIVPLGPHVDEFEHRLENYLRCSQVVALSAGTAAIHLGLVMLDVKAGDEVIVQDLTFSASANPVRYQGATPVFVDSEPDTWNMSPDLLRHAIDDRIKVTGRKPKAIIPVHLYGMPAKMDEIRAIAAEYDIPILEDAAEALGSEYKGRMCGTLGRYGALSFNGNKIITTSGGGALVCPGAEEAARVKFYATQSRENRPYYYHEVIGFNYRLSNISAAIGCGQIESLQARVERRRAIHRLYSEMLSDIEGITVQENPSDEFSSNFWLSTILIDPATGIIPDNLRLALAEKGIETRLLWRPMHMMPFFADCPAYTDGTAESLFVRGLCLPSGSSLTDEDIIFVAETIRSYIHDHRI
ncbi:MAG: aminotransferase class I/II-fold pyridoxal phosphate-dependent enzyme [Bacteroidales bacterium]|nr:aminotransferase class I/II-fold pyridoxal phosphate-dependent enzyme [Bacteroidales bacterium]